MKLEKFPPEGETAKVSYYSKKGERKFILTASDFHNIFTLYRVTGDTVEKLGQSENPMELEKEFHIEKELRE